MQTVSSSVAAMTSGLAQVQSEIKVQRQGKAVRADDRFMQVMEVRDLLLVCRDR